MRDTIFFNVGFNTIRFNVVCFAEIDKGNNLENEEMSFAPLCLALTKLSTAKVAEALQRRDV